jgi:hypothetical protein
MGRESGDEGPRRMRARRWTASAACLMSCAASWTGEAAASEQLTEAEARAIIAKYGGTRCLREGKRSGADLDPNATSGPGRNGWSRFSTPRGCGTISRNSASGSFAAPSLPRFAGPDVFCAGVGGAVGARIPFIRRLALGMKKVILAFMKTAISIPDDVFQRAERAAKRLGISRSELFTRAMQEFLGIRRSEEITASYNEAFGDGDDRETSAFRREATRRQLLNVEWRDTE